MGKSLTALLVALCLSTAPAEAGKKPRPSKAAASCAQEVGAKSPGPRVWGRRGFLLGVGALGLGFATAGYWLWPTVPPVTLVGEVHTDAHYRDAYYRRAVAGDIVLAVEDLGSRERDEAEDAPLTRKFELHLQMEGVRPDARSRFVVIEDEFRGAASRLQGILSDFARYARLRDRASMADLLLRTYRLDGRVLDGVWNRVLTRPTLFELRRREFDDGARHYGLSEEEARRYVQELWKDIQQTPFEVLKRRIVDGTATKTDLERAIDQRIEKFGTDGKKAFLLGCVQVELAREFGRMALSEPYATTMQVPPEMRHLGYSSEAAFRQKVMIEWRDEKLAENAWSAIETARREGLPCVVVVGADHLPGVRRRLVERGLHHLEVVDRTGR